MKAPFLSLTTGGIFAILLGFIFIGLSSHHSGQNDEFHERGLSREGRVASHQEPGKSSPYALRLKTNISHNDSEAEIQFIEIEVQKEDFQKAPVGSLLQLVLIPGNPPRARLADSAEPRNYRFGYVIASLCLSLGALLLSLDWHQHRAPAPQHSASNDQATKNIEAVKEPKPKKTTPLASHSDLMEKQVIKNPILYDGPFEFSYSTEKTTVELKNGTIIRVSQYRPISDLPKVLADQDLLLVLRSAQSDWKLIDTIKTGQLALSHLLKERHASHADQFFINGPYLGLLYRDETDTGHWHSLVRGIWKITPLSRTIGNLTSGDPDLARKASFEIINHPDLALIASLAPGLPALRGALKDTPRSGEFADDRRFITRAADIIASLSKGNCYCHVHAKGSDPADILIKKGKFSLTSGKKGDKKTEINCSHCKRDYTLTELVGSDLPYHVWEEKE